MEAAVVGRPVVVAYKVSFLTKIMVQLATHVKYLSLPNNLAGYRLVPELMQENCTAENLVLEISHYIDNETQAKKVTQAFLQIRNSLDLDSDRLAAGSVLEMLGLSAKTGNES